MIFGIDLMPFLTFGVLGYFIYLTVVQRKAQEIDIPPLDVLDAKKLDEMVAKQVELSLIPLLRSKGYQEEQIDQILTRTSMGRKTLRR
jgi:hypothetical protein